MLVFVRGNNPHTSIFSRTARAVFPQPFSFGCSEHQHQGAPFHIEKGCQLSFVFIFLESCSNTFTFTVSFFQVLLHSITLDCVL